MNETQKRYTVEQITKFNSEANDYEKNQQQTNGLYMDV